MLHASRRWVVVVVDSAEDLAEKLTQVTWCACNAFQVAGTEYLFLNDATSPDGAQEYAVVRGSLEGPPWLQVESITFSWCSKERALEFILCTLGDHLNFARRVTLRLDGPQEHGRCRHCA